MIQRDDFSARFHCNGHSVSDLNGDQEGTCDPQTGEWTLPMCISPDLSVTKETDIVNSSNLLTEIQLTDGFFLHNETRTSPSDQLTEQVTELPGTNSGPTVPGSDEVVNRSNLSTEISHNEELTLLNESPTSASKQLAEQVTRLTVSIPGLAVPVNGEVVNRSSFAMIAVIAIQFCAFIFFN